MNHKIKKGVIFALLTALISGLSIFYNKSVIVKGIDPSIFNIVKNGGAAIILSGLILFSSQRKELFSLNLNKWMKLILISVVGGSIPFMLYFEGLRSVSAIDANIIHKTMFIWVAILAIPILGERLNFWQVIGYGIVAWSNLFIGGFKGFTINSGELMILAATIFWSVENIVAKWTLSQVNYQITAWSRMMLGVIILLTITLFQNKLPLFLSLKSDQLLPILGSIILLTGYVITWYKALQLAPATIVTSILIIATPITNLLTTVFINHTLPPIQLVNLIFTTVGIALISFFALQYTNQDGYNRTSALQ